jgi:ubiquinone/menaquinone biosynthesis C-methylase UbiE
MTAIVPNYQAITDRQQATWAAGDFARIGSRIVLHGELLCEAVNVRPGEQVLDVAAGNGAASVAAARRWAEVTATDFVDHLLESARKVAEAYGLPMQTRVADAQQLPFDNNCFDVVLSTFGAMFAPDQQKVADELVRVCRPGGRIGMVNWAPKSLIGDVFRVTGKHVPPPAGVRPAIEWGTEDRLRELFGERISDLSVTIRQYPFQYRSADHMLDYFRTWYGPTRMAFAALDADGQSKLAADLTQVYQSYNRATDGTLDAPSDYAEVVAVVR